MCPGFTRSQLQWVIFDDVTLPSLLHVAIIKKKKEKWKICSNLLNSEWWVGLSHSLRSIHVHHPEKPESGELPNNPTPSPAWLTSLHLPLHTHQCVWNSGNYILRSYWNVNGWRANSILFTFAKDNMGWNKFGSGKQSQLVTWADTWLSRIFDGITSQLHKIYYPALVQGIQPETSPPWSPPGWILSTGPFGRVRDPLWSEWY